MDGVTTMGRAVGDRPSVADRASATRASRRLGKDATLDPLKLWPSGTGWRRAPEAGLGRARAVNTRRFCEEIVRLHDVRFKAVEPYRTTSFWDASSSPRRSAAGHVANPRK